ncbi:uncharacterized protein LOC116848928 [Odontomachus brunneus]|uniref:uncharacterized protein LOC116848928 n=1 Tax=Odontomachus brunneus TaxID=486640 RepID=UPI0013F1DFED|nr:uncharacterized protein LOC116848928 [Odontomachus brunneus]XP_032681451.1 uncharacterized protein LOC116848928 [Odontomachus brunneus]
MRVIFTVLVATCNLVAAKSVMNFTKIFPNINRCTHNQQFFDQCIRQSIRAIESYLLCGVPQLNILSHDPYIIDHRTIKTKDVIFNGIATLTNIRIYGLTDYEIYKVEYIGPTLEMRIEAFFPRIQFYAYYDIDGTLMLAPIKRRDHEMSITCRDVRAFILLNGTHYIRSNGLQYFKVETAPVDLYVRKARINFQDLHDSFNLMLNEYLNAKFEKTFHTEIMIKIGYFASEIIMTTANKIYWNFPISTLLLNP